MSGPRRPRRLLTPTEHRGLKVLPDGREEMCGLCKKGATRGLSNGFLAVIAICDDCLRVIAHDLDGLLERGED